MWCGDVRSRCPSCAHPPPMQDLALRRPHRKTRHAEPLRLLRATPPLEPKDHRRGTGHSRALGKRTVPILPPEGSPAVMGDPSIWWCAGSRMHVSRTRCFRCGGITRSPANSTLTTVEADLVHRRHAIIETVFADLIDGPLAHMPSGSFGANSAWVLCAAIAHNLLCANGILAGERYGRAREATLRRRIVCWSRRSPGRRSVDRAHEHGP